MTDLVALLKAHEGPSYMLSGDDFMCCCGTRLTKTDKPFMVGVTEAWREHLADVIRREVIQPIIEREPARMIVTTEKMEAIKQSFPAVGAPCKCGHPEAEHPTGWECQERDRFLPCGCQRYVPRQSRPEEPSLPS